MITYSVLVKDFNVFILMGPTTMVTVYSVTMVTIVMLYTYHSDVLNVWFCLDPRFGKFFFRICGFVRLRIKTEAHPCLQIALVAPDALFYVRFRL